jgi:hypothetical protein
VVPADELPPVVLTLVPEGLLLPPPQPTSARDPIVRAAVRSVLAVFFLIAAMFPITLRLRRSLDQAA